MSSKILPIDDYDYMFKVVLIGDRAVGKSNLLSRYSLGCFIPNARSTIGVEFSTRTSSVDGKTIMTEIWDTAGEERFRAITAAYYRNAIGAVIVYDITERRTFENVEIWLREVKAHVLSDAVVMLVGNKTDLRHLRDVSTQEGEAFAKANGMLFLETSCENGSNVDEAFTALITDATRHRVHLEKERTVQKPSIVDSSKVQVISNKGPDVIRFDKPSSIRKQPACCASL